MSTVLEHQVEIDRPVGDVFAYLDDVSHAQDWLYGLRSIEPVGEQVSGVGAAYDGVIVVGVELSTRIECTAWEQDRLIELTSTDGIRNTQRWTFEAIDAERTRVGARVEYALPGGPAGAVMGRAMKPFVGVAVRQTSRRLVRNLEAQAA
ncbi:SRPBCC family protein [Nocardioides sp. R-C-SC26]|uniref:SRPBCC family protein n=1 Tax=Nocardioides sp. R-C-SC26 TaxID=2870414 RepID=UPI001E3A8551|nr:SRPBCC family protein [Nocardioides sp. R-C-SC26]